MIFEAQYRAGGSRRAGSALARWAGWFGLGLVGVLGLLALAVVATAATLVALIGLGALAALRLAGQARPTGDPSLLEGRRTAEGWIVEAAPRPR